ncbi:MAG: hypothetical protein HYZ67_03070 [Chlamydiae bacterium]|nr:hypothetical protein [Chlamydiota bacterium]
MSYGQDMQISGMVKASSTPVEFKELLENIQIPNEIGEIIDQKIVPNRPMLYIIEDIHCHSEVQANIARILKQLEVKSSKLEEKNKETFKTSNFQHLTSNRFYVFSEGSVNKMDMSFFTGFPDKEALQKAQSKFIKDHSINGVEAFLIGEGNHMAEGLGAEDLSAYVDNIKFMGEFMEEKELQEQVWSNLEETFKNLRKKIYSPELLELMNKRDQYSQFKIGVKEYVSYLLDEESKSSQYPTIQKFTELQVLEEETDISKVESEYLAFLSELEKKLPKEELNEVLKNVLEHRLGRISDQEHYLFLSRYLDAEGGEGFSPLFFNPTGTIKSREGSGGS